MAAAVEAFGQVLVDSSAVGAGSDNNLSRIYRILCTRQPPAHSSSSQRLTKD